MSERTIFQCVARGCDGCSVCEDKMSDYDKEIEKAYLESRTGHEKQSDPMLVEIDRKGDWLHRYWFKRGYDSQKEKLMVAIGALENIRDMDYSDPKNDKPRHRDDNYPYEPEIRADKALKEIQKQARDR